MQPAAFFASRTPYAGPLREERRRGREDGQPTRRSRLRILRVPDQGRHVTADFNDLFDALRAHLDKVETIAESTFSNMPPELRTERLRRAIRAQFAREAVRQMAELVA